MSFILVLIWGDVVDVGAVRGSGAGCLPCHDVSSGSEDDFCVMANAP